MSEGGSCDPGPIHPFHRYPSMWRVLVSGDDPGVYSSVSRRSSFTGTRLPGYSPPRLDRHGDHGRRTEDGGRGKEVETGDELTVLRQTEVPGHSPIPEEGPIAKGEARPV